MPVGKTFLKGLALGAGLAYFFDPKLGTTRRAQVRGRCAQLSHRARQFVGRGLADLKNRTEGVKARARSLVTHERVPDSTIVERVRATMGHWVSHPHQVEVAVREGRVLLAGKLPSHELQRLLSAVRSVSGVEGIENHVQLEDGQYAHEVASPQRVSADHWSPAVRLLSAAAGCGLMAHCLARRGPAAALGGAAGLFLALCGITNRPTATLLGLNQGADGFLFERTVRIEAPVEKVYEYLSDYENSGRLMPHVKEVHNLGDGRLRWVLTPPTGGEWVIDEELIAEIPNELIAWRSAADAPVDYEGVVRFEPESPDATRLHVRLAYSPPAGLLGHAAASFLGVDPQSLLSDFVMRLKTQLETGVAPRDAR